MHTGPSDLPGSEEPLRLKDLLFHVLEQAEMSLRRLLNPQKKKGTFFFTA